MRIAICDDDSNILDQVSSLIRAWSDSGHNVSTSIFNNGDALIEAHSSLSFDVIFLDVVMPALNGLDTAREIRHSDSNVKLIFLTSSPEYAVDSYSVKASNCLL